MCKITVMYRTYLTFKHYYKIFWTSRRGCQTFSARGPLEGFFQRNFQKVTGNQLKALGLTDPNGALGLTDPNGR